MDALLKTSCLLVATLLCGCQPPAPADCQKMDANTARQVVVDYFQAITDKDLAQMQAYSTADYVLFERGMVWNNDSLHRAVAANPAVSIVYDIVDFKAEGDCGGAFVNYVNEGKFVEGDSTVGRLTWLESGYVKLDSGTPKLHFLHSTIRKR